MRGCLQSRPTHRVSALLPVFLAILAISGCAASPPPSSQPPPILQGYCFRDAYAHQAVGEVLPIEIGRLERMRVGSSKIISANFSGITAKGDRIDALTPEEAAQRAGDADTLRHALTDEGSTALVAKEVGLGPVIGATAGAIAGGPTILTPYFMALTIPVGTMYGLYDGVRLASSPQQRLNTISYRSGSRYSYLTTGVLHDHLFLFFLKADYRQLIAQVRLQDVTSGAESDGIIIQDWPRKESKTEEANKVGAHAIAYPHAIGDGVMISSRKEALKIRRCGGKLRIRASRLSDPAGDLGLYLPGPRLYPPTLAFRDRRRVRCAAAPSDAVSLYEIVLSAACPCISRHVRASFVCAAMDRRFSEEEERSGAPANRAPDLSYQRFKAKSADALT